MNLIKQLGRVATAASTLALAACSTGGKSPSGFLANYKQLDAGYGTADAVSSYVKPAADLRKYDSVIIDPVTTVVASPGISFAVTDQLAAYLGDSLRRQTTGELKVVSMPGPSTLRIRTALTDVIEDRKVGRAVTTVHAGARARLSGNLGSATIATFVSNVSFEGEILDSVTGERLLAITDHRLAVKREVTPATAWTTIRSRTQAGADRLHGRFNTLRAR
ncbi:MAG: DUF3313 domain-containing protein [Verrucomicrobia bacterium]|nr:DUF3313 domain-containing protein [Verrucomicrobiota bacterium]